MAVFSLAQTVASLPDFGGLGTGGLSSEHFVCTRSGYRLCPVIVESPPAQVALRSPDVATENLLKEVRRGFGRTFSYLPAVFGVSRQTLYNWLAGDVPRIQHQPKLQQLRAAARVFTAAGFTPNALSLGRTVEQGKSFLELLAGGADGELTAQKLVRIARSGSLARARLDALLGAGTPSKRPARKKSERSKD